MPGEDRTGPKLEESARGGNGDAGTAIHGDGAGSLERVEAEGVPRDAGRQHAPRQSAGRQRRSRAADRGADGSGDAVARSGGDGAAADDPAAAGRGSVDEPLGQLPGGRIEEAGPVNIPALDFVIGSDLELGKGTEGQKFRDNVDAIVTLKRIEAEERRATPGEQRILARYVGWGGLKNAFRIGGAGEGEGAAKGWEARVAEIEALLTPAELRAARNTVTAAHYTSQTVVQAMWRAAAHLGFDGGAVLEPAAGTGNFIGLMPQELRGKSSIFAVEYDSITARIAKLLYPNADILHSGLQHVPLPTNQFALAIGNPPFGRESLTFRYNPGAAGKSIHNQFFQVSLDALADDGLMAMVVSHHLMDALNPEARIAMAERAHFIGAVRLPDSAFRENARTEVVTDIMFFRKRNAFDQETAAGICAALRTGSSTKIIEAATGDHGQDILANIHNWVGSSTIPDPAGQGEAINLNGYFRTHPGMVIGQINASGTMAGKAQLECDAFRAFPI